MEKLFRRAAYRSYESRDHQRGHFVGGAYGGGGQHHCFHKFSTSVWARKCQFYGDRTKESRESAPLSSRYIETIQEIWCYPFSTSNGENPTTSLYHQASPSCHQQGQVLRPIPIMQRELFREKVQCNVPCEACNVYGEVQNTYPT